MTGPFPAPDALEVSTELYTIIHNNIHKRRGKNHVEAMGRLVWFCWDCAPPLARRALAAAWTGRRLGIDRSAAGVGGFIRTE